MTAKYVIVGAGIHGLSTEGFSYHPVGYLQISHEAMRDDVASIHEQQRAIGYESTFVEGAGASRTYSPARRAAGSEGKNPIVFHETTRSPAATPVSSNPGCQTAPPATHSGRVESTTISTSAIGRYASP